MLELFAAGVLFSSQTGGAQAASAPQEPASAIVPIFQQVYGRWRPPCDNPRASALRVAFDVTLDRRGRIVDGPDPVRPQDDPDWRRAMERVREALISAAPFDVPEGFAGGRYRPVFLAERVCGASR